MDFNVAIGAAPTPQTRVLLIEDERPVGEALVRAVERAGMQASWATCGADVTAMKTKFQPDVVLVDLALPDVDGVSLVKWLVDQQDCGVIVVSGMGDDADRVVGLELGADDYVAKPPHVRELIARIRAVHRRTAVRAQPERVSPAPASGQLRIDCVRRSVHGPDGKRIVMTSAEFAALETLFKADGQLVSRDELSVAALKRRWQPEDRSVDQLVLNLRQKLSNDADGQSLIQSVRGAGYLLRSDPTIHR